MRTAKTELLKWALSVLTKHQKETEKFSTSRRNFIKNTSKSAIAFALTPNFTDVKVIGNPRIAIIGGGLSGLTCAWKLKKAGFNATIYEASERLGGRTLTYKGFNHKSTVCEMGGEFFTSDHRHLVKMAKELSLKIYTASTPNQHLKPFKAYFGNQEVPLEKLEQSLADFYDKIMVDLESLPKYLSWEKAGTFRHLDEMSITEYLKSKEIDSLGYEFLKKAFTLENGMEAEEQSALNLLKMFNQGHTYQPSSKIRSMRLKRGNQSISQELSDKLWKNIKTDHRLVNLHQHTSWYNLKFEHLGRERKVNADIVVLTIPFSVLRNIETNVHFNERKRSAIHELGYGQKGSMLLGFQHKHWRELGYDGLTFSDELFGYGNDQNPRQKGKNQVLSIKPAGKEAEKFTRMDTADAAIKCLQSLNKIYPGINDHFDGQVIKYNWSNNRNFLGSNSCYKVGQYSRFGGEEGKSIENLFFAGEHCSHHYKGTMNGAIETGDLAATNIIRRFKSRKRRKSRP